ncbi:hypothetical protein [Solidesulfovibrio sp.]
MHWTTFKLADRATYPPDFTVFLIERQDGKKSLGWWDEVEDDTPGLRDGDRWMGWPTCEGK